MKSSGCRLAPCLFFSLFLVMPAVTLSQAPGQQKAKTEASAVKVASKTPTAELDKRLISEASNLASDAVLIEAVKGTLLSPPPTVNIKTWNSLRQDDPSVKIFQTNSVGKALSSRRTPGILQAAVYGPDGRLLGSTRKAPPMLSKTALSTAMGGKVYLMGEGKTGVSTFAIPVKADREIAVLMVRSAPPVPKVDTAKVTKAVSSFVQDPGLAEAMKIAGQNPPAVKMDSEAWSKVKPADPAFQPFRTNAAGKYLAAKSAPFVQSVALYGSDGKLLAATRKAALRLSKETAASISEGKTVQKSIGAMGFQRVIVPVKEKDKTIGAAAVTVDPRKL